MIIIFKLGNKQYEGKIGKILSLEKIKFNIGKILFIKKILLIINKKKIIIGKPIIKDIKLKIKIINHYLKKKIKIIKFKRRKHYKKIQGHRQWSTAIKIIDLIKE